jgi:hypothetical protein
VKRDRKGRQDERGGIIDAALGYKTFGNKAASDKSL